MDYSDPFCRTSIVVQQKRNRMPISTADEWTVFNAGDVDIREIHAVRGLLRREGDPDFPPVKEWNIRWYKGPEPAEVI